MKNFQFLVFLKKCIVIPFPFYLVAFLTSCSFKSEFDIVLKNGTIVDGSGANRFISDVAVKDGKIVLIKNDIAQSRAKKVLNVEGLIVSPGFWDNHAHLDNLEKYPYAENFIRQGITTIIASLHSQDQPFPMDDYIKQTKMTPNVGLFSGHTWIRKRVMGLEDRSPTKKELEWMKALVDSSMQQGALGLATGLEYIPAVFAKSEEIVELAKIASKYDGFYATHLRDEGVDVIKSFKESIDVARLANIPVQINHHKITGASHWGLSNKTLALLDSASFEGLLVAHDVYPYTAFSTYSDILFPGWALAGGSIAYKKRIEQADIRNKLESEMRIKFLQQTGYGPKSIQFRNIDSYPNFKGKTLEDFLLENGRSANLNEAVNAVIELQAKGGFIGIFEGMDESDVVKIIKHKTSMFNTDGDLVKPGEGFPHPRSYGAFPRVLAKYVRDEKIITLEEAINKMTYKSASWMRQNDRGLIKEGAIADITVFSMDKIQDIASYDDPHHYSEGVVHVIINGIPVLENKYMSKVTPGKFLVLNSKD